MPSILIVEDDDRFMKYLLLKLKNFFNEMYQTGESTREDKFLIYTAQDGQEAIEILKKRKISLLVTDVQMPRINGLVLLSYMNVNHPGIPCIVMTAHDKPAMNQKLIKDLLHYVKKPFQIEDLGQIILNKLQHKESEKSMQGISVASFLQLTAMEKQTCLLQVETRGKAKGLFMIKKGELFDAVFGNLKGIDAVNQMIPMQAEKINFLPYPSQEIPRRIEPCNLMSIIMNALKDADEKNERM